MNIVIGTLALAGGLVVLGRYLVERLFVRPGDLVPNPMWGAVGFAVAVLGFLLFLF
jgi:hypothetical protein